MYNKNREMGFKSAPYKKSSGLKFESKADYYLFKDLDKHIDEIVEQVNNHQLKLEDVFKDVKPITIQELYYCASDELDGTFENVTKLLMFEDAPHFTNEYKIGCKFFDKINIIEFKNDD